MDNLNINERIKALKTRGKEYNNRKLIKQIGKDRLFKQEIATLYNDVFQKQVSGCINCYADAFFELINLLKNEKAEIENGQEVAIENQFVLKRGVLLYDKLNLDASKMLCFTNLTTKLALYHLATNPDCVKYFAKLPDDWQQQVEEYKKTGLEQI